MSLQDLVSIAVTQAVVDGTSIWSAVYRNPSLQCLVVPTGTFELCVFAKCPIVNDNVVPGCEPLIDFDSTNILRCLEILVQVAIVTHLSVSPDCSPGLQSVHLGRWTRTPQVRRTSRGKGRGSS
jgi:hypothetical protein